MLAYVFRSRDGSWSTTCGPSRVSQKTIPNCPFFVTLYGETPVARSRVLWADTIAGGIGIPAFVSQCARYPDIAQYFTR